MIQLLRKTGRQPYFFFARFLVLMMNTLPLRLQVFIKSNSVSTRKLDYPHHEIVLHIDSEIEQNVRLISCQKEPETVDWIEGNFKEGDVFFDVGANVGAYSLVASKFCRDRIKVYSFEPGFMTFPQLCRNIISNGCMDNIVPLQVALSNKTAIDVFNYQNLIPGGAIHALGEAVDYKGESFETILKQPVLSFRMDDLIQHLQVPVPNHIKIDVDGIEFDVLQGAEKTLEDPAVKSIILELEEGSKDADIMIKYLTSKGMRFRSKHKYVFGGDTGPLSNTYNYVFERVDVGKPRD